VLYTDLVQMFILLGGAVTVTIIGLDAVGGWSALQAKAGPEYFSVWKSINHPDFPWTGILFGAPILGVWYWCTDQFIVQRVLSAENGAAARKGTILAGFLKQTPLFIFVIPGVIAYVLSQSGQLTLDQPDQALAALIGTLLPEGLRGLVAAGLLAALMSSLSSVFNSCSTIFTMDIYRRLKPNASERQLVVTGQIAVIVLIGFGLAWIPLMKNISGQLFTYLQSVQAYISPPIAAVFLIGVLWPRANAKGAVASLSVGFPLGMGRLVLEMNKESLSGSLLAMAEINFLHVALILFLICSFTLVIVSLMTAKPSKEHLEDLTWSHLKPDRRDPSLAQSRTRDLLLTVVLVALIGIVWITFS
jgi:SSS family solute:Na+ symporter